MITISLCMIVKNEAATIERCLSSVAGLMEEIIIVDTGSTDNTKELAALFTDKIYDFEWVDDFSAARNFSFAQGSMDYLLWLDADDIILPEDGEKLRQLKESLAPDIDGVMMPYNTGFDEEGRVIFSYFRERLVRRSAQHIWREPVHEYLEISGKRINAEVSITHQKPPGRAGHRNIHIYQSLLEKGEELSPRGQYYYARELKDNQLYPEAVTWFGNFLDGGQGWLEDNIAACGELAKCLLAMGQRPQGLAALLRSFSYDNPRAEICCQLGYFFKEQGQYQQAVFWFTLALGLKRDTQNWGFCQEDCWGYIPCIELAVCHEYLGDRAKAVSFNEAAALYKPKSEAVLHNRKYFSSRPLV